MQVILLMELIGKGWSMRAKFLLATFSAMSMAMQPLALAEQKKNWSGDVLREFVKASQPKGKSLTVKQFWDQNKAQLHPVWQQRFAPAIEIQKNDKLPKMEVINIKAPQGVESARMMMNIDGKVVSVEYLGGQEKFARINNTVITYQDFYYVTGMVEKLMKDPVFAGEQKKLEKRALVQTFVPSRKQFNQMSVAQRVEMIMKLRLASEAADQVIQMNLEGGVKTSQNFFWEVLLPVAHAQTQAQINAALGQSCLVAGHVGKFGKNKADYASCSVPNDVITSKSCPTSRPHGCNKLFFPRSGAICLAPSRTNQDYQNFTAKCAAATPISSVKDKSDFVKAAQADLKFELKGEKVEASDEEWAKLSTFMESHNKAIDETLKTACSDSNVAVVGKVETKLGSACDALKDRKLDLVRYQAETIGGGIVAPGPGATPAPGADGAPCNTQPVAGDSAAEKHDGVLKDGKCIPGTVPGAAGAVATGECAAKNLCDGTDGAGKKVCAPCGDRVIAGGILSGGGKPEPSFWERNKSWIIPGGIFAGLFLVISALFKSGNKGSAKAATPPAAPPLEPIPTPVIPNPVTPITPVSGSEGGTGTSTAPTGGQR